MSVQLSLLSLFALLLAMLPAVRPDTLYEYPCLVGLLVLGWVVPQAVAVEHLNLAAPFDPTIAWAYMSLCVFMLSFGYFLGRFYSGRPTALKPNEQIPAFNLQKLNRVAAAMVAIGAGAYFMMVRQASIDQMGTEWTGVVTVYAQLVNFLVYGGALAWLIYLKTGDRRALLLAIVATIVFLPIVLTAVKREATFQLAIIIVTGLFFTRRLVPPRWVIIIGCFAGIVLLHQVAAIRNYVKQNDSTLVGAIYAGEATKEFSIFNLRTATEVTSAVTDIAIARTGGNHQPFSSIWNGIVHQYFPAFIFGREAKESLKIVRFDEDPLSSRFESFGSTRTGFSDTFTDFWYFGCIFFGFIGWVYGRVYRKAVMGDFRYQFFFLILLPDGLMAITESVARFMTNMIFVVICMWIPFIYARVRAKPHEANADPRPSQSYA